MEITRNPAVWDKTINMGYPPYFIVLLGVAKIAGVITLLIPGRFNRLKEWVFAGMIFDVLFAFASGVHMDSIADCISPLIALILLIVTYTMFRKINRVIYSFS